MCISFIHDPERKCSIYSLHYVSHSLLLSYLRSNQYGDLLSGTSFVVQSILVQLLGALFYSSRIDSLDMVLEVYTCRHKQKSIVSIVFLISFSQYVVVRLRMVLQLGSFRHVHLVLKF